MRPDRGLVRRGGDEEEVGGGCVRMIVCDVEGGDGSSV